MNKIATTLCILTCAVHGQVAHITQVEGETRFGGLTLRNVDFRQAPFTNVLAEINRQLADSNVTVRFDFTPTKYFIPNGNGLIAEKAARLVRNRRTLSTGWTDSPDKIKDAALGWGTEQINLLDFLKGSLQVCGFVMTLRYRDSSILLAPGPFREECRAYRFGTNSVNKLRDIGGTISTAMFVDGSGWETNYMDWLDEDSILLKLDTPDNLDRYEQALMDIGDVQRVNLDQQECTTSGSKVRVPAHQ